MLRSLLSAVAVCVLAAATLFTPGLVSARRCVVKMPVTLLSLYRTSDFIYIGKFDRREEGESVESSSNYREIPIKNHFSISTTLKGESRKMVVLEDRDYIFTRTETFDTVPQSGDDEASDSNAQDDEDVAEEASESEETSDSAEVGDVPDEEAGVEDDGALKPGDPVILFLRKSGDKEDGAPTLADYQYGLKRLTAEQIGSYEVRLRELNGIFENGKPKYGDLVAWLVRCAEDPLTRWEGTYELLRSFQSVDWQKEHAAESEEKPQENSASEGEESTRLIIRLPKDFETGDPEFARALTEGQKLILTDTLMRRAQGTKDKSFGFGDRELIELVSKWGDSKVASNLLEQLRSVLDDTDVAPDLMQSIAAIFNDDELTRIAALYADIRWESAEEQVEAEYLETDEHADAQDESDAVDDATPVEPEVSSEPESADDPVENDSDEAEVETPEKAPTVKKTYEQFRIELIQKFLERSANLLARENKTPREN